MQLYKWIGRIVGFLALVNICHVNAHEDHHVNYEVSRSDYKFSSEFYFNNTKHSFGKVIKSVFRLFTTYDSYDRYGLYDGQGTCRLSFWGLFYAWGSEIVVYDAYGYQIGLIDGQAGTTAAAKFSFYNEQKDLVGIAYLDTNCMGFTIVDPENSSRILAQLTRNYVRDAIDTWDVIIFDSERLPEKLVKIFAAFACDTQDKFKPDR